MAGSESQYPPASNSNWPLTSLNVLLGWLSHAGFFSNAAYIFAHASKKNGGKHVEHDKPKPASSSVLEEYWDPYDSIPERLTPLHKEPISEDQQRELFEWMLEEKRKVKPRGREEKKQVDKEKAILKQFITAKSISSI